MCVGGGTDTHANQTNIGGNWVNNGQATSQDAAWIRANTYGYTLNKSKGANGFPTAEAAPGETLRNTVLGWGSVAAPETPDLTDQTLQSARQAQILSGLAQQGYMSTFLGR